MMKVSIVGLGSLGGFLAARLSSFPDIQIQWSIERVPSGKTNRCYSPIRN